jgi:hypothetical protein
MVKGSFIRLMTTLFKKAGGRWFAYIANGAKIQQKMGNLRTLNIIKMSVQNSITTLAALLAFN